MRSPSKSVTKRHESASCHNRSFLCHAHNTGYVNYADCRANVGLDLSALDSVLRERLAKSYILNRARYGFNFPRPWRYKPMTYYRFALDLIAEIFADDSSLMR